MPVIPPPGIPDVTLRSAASAPPESEQTTAIVASAGNRLRRNLIGFDDLLALDLVSLERTACCTQALPSATR